MVYFKHFCCTCDFFLDFGGEHAFHGALHLLDGLVDYRVQADVYTIAFGRTACRLRRAHLETDDDGVRCRSQCDIAFRYLADSLVEYVYLYFFGRQFYQ